MKREDELQVLHSLAAQTAMLMETNDALMAGQYSHLHGRITALIAVLATTQQECSSLEEEAGHAETEQQGSPDHRGRIGPG